MSLTTQTWNLEIDPHGYLDKAIGVEQGVLRIPHKPARDHSPVAGEDVAEGTVVDFGGDVLDVQVAVMRCVDHSFQILVSCEKVKNYTVSVYQSGTIMINPNPKRKISVVPEN